MNGKETKTSEAGIGSAEAGIAGKTKETTDASAESSAGKVRGARPSSSEATDDQSKTKTARQILLEETAKEGDTGQNLKEAYDQRTARLGRLLGHRPR